jgi:hypothetical protein
MPAGNVTVTATFRNPDKEAVSTAKALIEGAAYTVAQASANDQTNVKTWLAGEINGLPGFIATGITVADADITVSSLTSATTGGTDGSFAFTVTLTKGGSSATTNSRTGVITATPIVNAAAPLISGHPQSATVNTGVTVTLSVTAASPDGGTLSYQWYSNTTNTNTGGTEISGETSVTCSLSPATTGTYYYYVVVTNTNTGVNGAQTATATGSAATVEVNSFVNAQTPVIGTQPTDVSVDEGMSATLSVAASVSDGGTLSYQWYGNTTNTNTGGTAITGETSANYSPPTVTSGTYYYYVMVTNTNTDVSITGVQTATVAVNPATVTVNAIVNTAAPVISGHPQDITVADGAGVTLTVTASVSDGGTLSYQWYSNTTDDNTGGTAIPGATTATCMFTASGTGTTYYYVEVTNTASVNGIMTATTTSSTAAVAVTASGLVHAQMPTITTHPQSLTVNEGSSLSLSVTASVSDGGTLSYQWYGNTANSNTGGTAIPGATGISYTPPTTAAGDCYYYVVVKNTNTDASITGTQTATAASNPAAVTVKALVHAQAPVIGSHPQSAAYTQNATAAALTVTASVTDGGALSYQWYGNTANTNTGGTAISGATGTSYTPPTIAAGTTYYYAVVTNTNTGAAITGTTTATTSSNPATVTVTPVTITNAQTPVITSHPQDATVDTGGSVALTVTASVSDGGTLSYQWYRNAANSNTGGTAIPGATGTSYSPPTASAGTTYYYVAVTNTNTAVNGSTTATTRSNPAKVSVNSPAPPVATYAVTVATTTNGTVTVSPVYAAAGTTIVLTVTPAAGYETETLTVFRTGAGSLYVTVYGTGNTRTFTMPSYNVTVRATFRKTQAQLDREAVETAKTAIEGGTYRISQATGNTEAAVRTWLVNTLRVLFGQSADIQIRSAGAEPVNAEVRITSLTPATEGTETNPSGVNGSFRFTVTLKRGQATAVTAETPGVIIATPHAATPVKRIELLPLGGTTVRILNTGNVSTGDLTLTLSGTHAAAFIFSPASPGSLPAGSEADIRLTPDAGLTPGVYTLTLTVSADGLTPVSTDIAYTVTPVGTEEIPQAKGLKAWQRNGMLHVSGLTAGKPWSIYNISGALVYHGAAGSDEANVSLPVRGVYIVKSGNAAVKVAY